MRRMWLRSAPALVTVTVALAIAGCSRVTVRSEARAVGSLTVSGWVIMSRPLGPEDGLSVRAVPVNPPPAFGPWLPREFYRTVGSLAYGKPTRTISRNGRQLLAYAFSVTVPRAVRIVKVRERQTLTRRARQTSSHLWQPGGYRLAVRSWEGWKWLSNQVFSSTTADVQLSVQTAGYPGQGVRATVAVKRGTLGDTRPNPKAP
jgi:hypothetical protein